MGDMTDLILVHTEADTQETSGTAFLLVDLKQSKVKAKRKREGQRKEKDRDKKEKKKGEGTDNNVVYYIKLC